jgi:hypothetical protein
MDISTERHAGGATATGQRLIPLGGRLRRQRGLLLFAYFRTTSRACLPFFMPLFAEVPGRWILGNHDNPGPITCAPTDRSAGRDQGSLLCTYKPTIIPRDRG